MNAFVLSILTISSIWFTLTTLILLRNRLQFRGMFEREPETEFTPLVSVLIPARNEEDVIGRCIESVLKQTYPNFELLVLNDQSTDATSTVLESFSDKKLNVINGDNKPVGWLGKQAACAQLSKHASGEILLFIDADVWLDVRAIERTVITMKKERIGLLTVWPEQIMKTFWENVVVSGVYHTLFSVLPSIYVKRSPRWIPRALRTITNPLFAAACGQYMAFDRSVYETLGGHEAVKQAIVEDVAFARLARANQVPMNMYHGSGSVYCRMYTAHGEIVNGFRKNFLAGFGHSIILFGASGVLHFLVYILVWAGFFYYPFWTLTVVLAPILQRLLLAHWFNHSPVYGVMHILTVLWFQILGVVVVIDHLFGKKITWKGRTI